MSATKSSNWKVRPGYAFAAGAGLGGGLFLFEFFHPQENRIYGMGFAGAGLAGSPLKGGAVSSMKDVIKKLAMAAGLKGAGWAKGEITGTPPGYQDQNWSPVKCNKPFSSDDLNGSSGRVTILGASVLKVGYYGCYVSSSDGVVSLNPLFGSVSVDVRPQNFDLQLGVILGVWWESFDIPA